MVQETLTNMIRGKNLKYSSSKEECETQQALFLCGIIALHYVKHFHTEF